MAKRLFDLILSLLALILLAPIFICIALAIRLDSPGPVLFRSTRTGQGGREFRLFKFRSMVVNAEHLGPGITTSGDARITRIGRFLRRTKLDELPQLINILRGEMSFVGPRPEAPEYVALYTPEQREVLAVRPGLTSPASVQYRSEEALLSGPDWESRYIHEIMPHKLSLDLAYVQQASFWLDIRIILQTLAALFRAT